MRSDPAYLHDILDSVAMLRQFVSGKTLDAFRQDLVLQQAVMHRVGIIGEAARCLTKPTRGLMPEIP